MIKTVREKLEEMTKEALIYFFLENTYGHKTANEYDLKCKEKRKHDLD